MDIQFDDDVGKDVRQRIEIFLMDHPYKKKSNRVVVSVRFPSSQIGLLPIYMCLFYKGKVVKCATLVRVRSHKRVAALEEQTDPRNPFADVWSAGFGQVRQI